MLGRLWLPHDPKMADKMLGANGRRDRWLPTIRETTETPVHISRIKASVVRLSGRTLQIRMAEGGKDPSRAIVAGGNRARARDLEDHAKAREELPQWCFRHAAQQGYFDGANPVKLAEVPAFAPNGAEAKPYSREKIAAMLKVLSEPSATAVATAAFTGPRLGELRRLTWESFEPAQDEKSLGSLNVTRSVWRSTVGDRKTAKSEWMIR
jgi:integrase